MPQKLHLFLLILVTILLLFGVSTLNTTTDNAKPVFVYGQSAAPLERLPSIAPEALPARWQAAPAVDPQVHVLGVKSSKPLTWEPSARQIFTSIKAD